MDVATFDFLLSSPGQRLLGRAMAAYDGDALRLSAQLRRDVSATPEQVAAAVTQVVLRSAAAAKFGAAADRMYFTSAGLEQATAPLVARRRAERAAALVTGSCVDLGCGIGADLLAFAAAGFAVTGVDSDEVTARIAEANLAAARLPGSVQAAPAETMDLRTADLVFADPSRRRGAARLFDPRSFSPPWPVVLDLLRRPAGSGRPNSLRAVVKLAPGLDHALVPDHVEADWVSLNGQLKEVALWAPAPGSVRRRATLIRSETGTVSCTDAGAPAEPPAVGSVGRYLYEPDPAVIRAHLVSAAVAEVDGWLLDPHIAYVCSDREVRSALSRRYRVLDVLPVKEKALRAALAARGIGPITIKKRGVQISPEELRRRLALQGSRSATLVLTRTPGSATALLVEPGE